MFLQTENKNTENENIAVSNPLDGKKIALVTHSDMLGGAAIVTFRLMQALRRKGLDARMVVYTKVSSEENVSVHRSRFRRGISLVLERLRIIASMGFHKEDLFKVSTGDFAINVHDHPWVREADIVALGWFNQGLLGLKGIARLHEMGKKIVWTLHDMWAFTGICHHAYECGYFTDRCGNCMFLSGGGAPNDLSARVWEQKRRLYAEVPITFVTVSRWLERKARESSLLRSLPVMTIHNAFPVEQFFIKPSHHIDSLLSSMKPNLILIGAARLDDPIKGLPYAIEALNHIFDNYPDVATTTAVYLFGSMKDPSLIDNLRMSHRWLGRINDFKILAYLYASAKVVLSSSLYETLGGTLVEGQAAGAIPVTFGGDGREDVVEHKVTGYIARYKDARDLAAGVMWALKADISRQELHDSVEARFGSSAIADKYIELFKSLFV